MILPLSAKIRKKMMETSLEGNRSTVFMFATPYSTVLSAVKQPDPHVPKGFRKNCLNFTLGSEQKKRVIDPSANYTM